MRHAFAAVLLVAVVAALSTTPAAAKEGVVARVLTPVPRDAVPGTTVAVVWTLSSRGEDGKRRPFNAEA